MVSHLTTPKKKQQNAQRAKFLSDGHTYGSKKESVEVTLITLYFIIYSRTRTPLGATAASTPGCRTAPAQPRRPARPAAAATTRPTRTRRTAIGKMSWQYHDEYGLEQSWKWFFNHLKDLKMVSKIVMLGWVSIFKFFTDQNFIRLWRNLTIYNTTESYKCSK